MPLAHVPLHTPRWWWPVQAPDAAGHSHGMGPEHEDMGLNSEYDSEHADEYEDCLTSEYDDEYEDCLEEASMGGWGA